MIRKQHKKYSKPKKLFDKARIEEENQLIKKYGLKNKKEIWKAEYYLSRLRNQARKLITAPIEKKQEFIARLVNKGIAKKNSQIDDILALTKEAILERRLQTIVFQKKLARTPKEARQLITHKHIKVKDRIVNIPSYFVDLEEENQITKKEQRIKKKTEEKNA
ncbi:MAG: 30S ribosomal protein S4 [Candidatus Pacearchaeota archaeon]